MINPKTALPVWMPGTHLFQKKAHPPKNIALIEQFCNWCGVYIPSHWLKDYLNNTRKAIPLHEIAHNTVCSMERVRVVCEALRKQAPQAPQKIDTLTLVAPAVIIPTAQTTSRPWHLRSGAIDTVLLDQLYSNEVFRSISASKAARLLLMEQYVPGGREVLCQQVDENSNSLRLAFLGVDPMCQRLLEKLAQVWSGVFGSDWILHGAYPAGNGFGHYAPGFATLNQLWVLHLHRCNGMTFPEPGKLIFLANQFNRFIHDERFIRHSASLCGRLLLIRVVSGQTLAAQRNLLETECREICRAKDGDFHLLSMAVKCYADRAGSYWLNTGKGLPGAFFLYAVLRGTDWLSEADILLHRELLRYPELPAPVTNGKPGLRTERYCAGCGAPLFGVTQKKYCSSICQQRTNRNKKKQPHTEKPGQHTDSRADEQGFEEQDNEQATQSPEFLSLVADLLLNGNAQKKVLDKLSTLLRTQGQEQLAAMLDDEQSRKALLQNLYNRLNE